MESFLIRTDQTEDIMCEIEQRNFEIFQSEKDKEKRILKNQRTYIIYGIQSKNQLANY